MYWALDEELVLEVGCIAPGGPPLFLVFKKDIRYVLLN